MKKHITYIISNINKALAFEWINDYINQDKFDLSFILLNADDSELEQYLKRKGTKVYRVVYRSKKDFFTVFFKVRKILKKEKTQVIHTHLLGAALVGLSAGKSLGIKKRINTRHHSTSHHVYFPRAVFYDKIINYLATHIVAISQNVKSVLVDREKVKTQKISIIHHGFKLNDFDAQNIPQERINILSEKYQTQGKSPVIGVIARYVHWKGIQFIIPAFEKLLEKYPNAHLVLANAQGEYKNELQQLLAKLPENSFTEITFENDLFALYQLFDIYIHTPIDNHSEAFGQTYVEALSASIPSIFTLSGVASEFIEHEKNALVVPFQDTNAIYDNIIKLLKEKKIKENLTKQGKEDVFKLFTLKQMINSLENLYAN